MQITATPEELLDVVRELFPREYDRSMAELTIRKQAARIAELESLSGAADPAAPGPAATAAGDDTP